MSTPRTLPLPALVALAALGAACAAPRVTARPAHSTFDPGQLKGTTAGALGAVKARGYDVAFHDAQRGLILTRTREGQAPCAATECLTRDTFVIRLEDGHATAVLSRQIFDSSLRAWDVPHDPADLDAIEAEELALLRAFLTDPAALRPSRAGEPCAAAVNCEAGLACEARHCAVPKKASSRPARLPIAPTKAQ